MTKSTFILIKLVMIDFELIPQTLMAEDCPSNMNHTVSQLTEQSPTIQTCICEDHCSIDMCNLVHPPNNCLPNIPSKWSWNYLKDTWVAQVDLGNNILCLI